MCVVRQTAQTQSGEYICIVTNLLQYKYREGLVYRRNVSSELLDICAIITR